MLRENEEQKIEEGNKKVVPKEEEVKDEDEQDGKKHEKWGRKIKGAEGSSKEGEMEKGKRKRERNMKWTAIQGKEKRTREKGKKNQCSNNNELIIHFNKLTPTFYLGIWLLTADKLHHTIVAVDPWGIAKWIWQLLWQCYDEIYFGTGQTFKELVSVFFTVT